MPICETCGNDYDKTFQVIMKGKTQSARHHRWHLHVELRHEGGQMVLRRVASTARTVENTPLAPI
jgi:hypothetical protein